ncbi:MAG: hypothetical protein J6S85_23805 [Methanobrevibacter sp.]|nr:hypothetical protein [Methanobrevibacter sp.]
MPSSFIYTTVQLSHLSHCEMYKELYLIHQSTSKLHIRYKKKKYKNKNLLYELLFRFAKISISYNQSSYTSKALIYFTNELISIYPDLFHSSYRQVLEYIQTTSQTFLNLVSSQKLFTRIT